MPRNATLQLNAFTDRLKRLIGKSTDPKILRALGEEATTIIVRRTRLGQTARRTTVSNELGKVRGRVIRLKPHKPSYKKFRKTHRDKLSEFTRVGRSNLTFSGQLLASVGIVRVTRSSVIINARGARKPVFPGRREPSNPKLAEYVTEQGRPFLELSALDDKKLVRFYRRTFGDLVRRSGINNK